MSFSHLLILGIIAVIVIPPDKLPEVARQVAKFLGDMRRMTSGIFDDLKQDVVLKPEDMLKKKNENTIHPPAETAPPVVAMTPEERAKADEEYKKSIQVPPTPDEKT
jgi:sec-independent protein translocase protein TatB